MPSAIKHIHRGEHDLQRTLASMFDWAKENPLPVAAIGAGLGASLASVIRKAGRERVQGRKSDLGAARAPEALGVFREHEADWMFQRTLAYMNVGAAEIGECLHTARRINERDAESWPSEWAEVAARVDAQGDQAVTAGDPNSARRAFLRASNYYRAAQYGCVPSHPRYHELWEASVAAFKKAATLFDPPVQPIEVSFEGTKLPGYFWRPDETDIKRPTLVVAGGNDDTIEEDFFIIGPAAVERGYNFFTFSYPGHRNAVHTDPGQVKRLDYEVPFKVALDLLKTLTGVDERIVLMGFSGGGYVAPRVTINDERIKAVIANNPMIDYARVARALLSPMIERVPGGVLDWMIRWKLDRNPLMKAYMEYGLWTAGYAGMSLYEWLTDQEAQQAWAEFTIANDLHKIACPALALVGAGEGDEMLKQTREFYEGISAKEKKLHVFTLEEDGTYDHCLLDNHLRMHHVTFEWLSRCLRSKSRSTRKHRSSDEDAARRRDRDTTGGDRCSMRAHGVPSITTFRDQERPPKSSLRTA